ncbi:hypothetical protein L6164_009636 [Bauhinia variegata]|uniref:Uncharacterized protein n=1 Tax=Bauhinia variegata TaxID=167791 RepID=A0ACB9PLQ2_BAUVA|nr:hypothetical protein L6164_009636 [Bauhinia variegata]
MTSSVKATEEITKEVGMEDDEDLFEIDLEAVNCMPPPQYWDSYCTSTGSALLANCLLPISDISSAVPASHAAAASLPATTNVFLFTDSMSLGEYLRLPFLRADGFLNKG